MRTALDSLLSDAIDGQDDAPAPSAKAARTALLWKLALVIGLAVAAAVAALSITNAVVTQQSEFWKAAHDAAWQNCIDHGMDGAASGAGVGSGSDSSSEVEAYCTMVEEDGALIERYGD